VLRVTMAVAGSETEHDGEAAWLAEAPRWTSDCLSVGSAGGAGSACGVGQGACVNPPPLPGWAQQQAHLPPAVAIGHARVPRAHCPAEAGKSAKNRTSAANQLTHRA